MNVSTDDSGLSVVAPAPRWAFAASLLLLAGACGGSGGTAAPPPPGLLDGPIVGRVTDTSVTISWRSGAASIGGVEYGLDPSYGAVATETIPATEHRVALAGLVPDGTYHYRIHVEGGGDETALGDHDFHLAPDGDHEPFRMVVVGDSGAGTPEESEVVDAIVAAEPEVILHTGDIAYGNGSPSQVSERFLDPYQLLLARIPIYAVLGNHDDKTNDGAPLLSVLTLPVNSADGTSHFYSFDWGDVHVVALDSNDSLAPNSSQASWLDADLGASRAMWKIVFFHHPPYSSSKNGSNLGIRNALGPIFDRNHVDLVLNGHDHDYERTYPMSDGAVADANPGPDYADPPGTIFVVTGGGGQSLYPAATSDFTVLSESAFHFVALDVTPTTITSTATRLDGSVIDRFSITKAD